MTDEDSALMGGFVVGMIFSLLLVLSAFGIVYIIKLATGGP